MPTATLFTSSIIRTFTFFNFDVHDVPSSKRNQTSFALDELTKSIEGPVGTTTLLDTFI